MSRRRVSTALSALALGFIVASTLALVPAASAQDPNYVWRDDVVAKTLAGKPYADRVLHRVPGSFHDAPRIPEAAREAQARGNGLYGPGTPVLVGQRADRMCTIAVAGYDDAGRKVALTAGHCGAVGEPITSADAVALGPAGSIVHVNQQYDFALIHLGPNTEVTRSYDGVTINNLGSAPIPPGRAVCKKGVASGVTCGVTWHDYDAMNINQVCAMQGDSGGPLFVGDRLVGLVSGGMFPPPFSLPCRTPLQGVIFSPTGSARADAVLSRVPGGFRLP